MPNGLRRDKASRSTSWLRAGGGRSRAAPAVRSALARPPHAPLLRHFFMFYRGITGGFANLSEYEE